VNVGSFVLDDLAIIIFLRASSRPEAAWRG
jgi:hypothetical protein